MKFDGVNTVTLDATEAAALLECADMIEVLIEMGIKNTPQWQEALERLDEMD